MGQAHLRAVASSGWSQRGLWSQSRVLSGHALKPAAFGKLAPTVDREAGPGVPLHWPCGVFLYSLL